MKLRTARTSLYSALRRPPPKRTLRAPKEGHRVVRYVPVEDTTGEVLELTRRAAFLAALFSKHLDWRSHVSNSS